MAIGQQAVDKYSQGQENLRRKIAAEQVAMAP